MEKRYQVFISSTFNDLEDERRGLMQTLMQLDCIPAGMELFPAADEEQWAFIQKVIDDCDYYLLVIGGRYGTTTAEGVSYTEKEYGYAVSKGIHVIALLHGEPEKLPFDKSEPESVAREKLSAFRTKASADRLVKFWKSSAELLQQTVLSLTHGFKAHPRPGWIRGGSNSSPELLAQLNDLRQRNDDLQKQLDAKANVSQSAVLKLAPADSMFELAGRSAIDQKWVEWRCSLSWKQIIGAIGPHLLNPVPHGDMNEMFARLICSYTQQRYGSQAVTFLVIFDTVKVQLLALGYIEIGGGIWKLTDLGKQVMFDARAIISQGEESA